MNVPCRQCMDTEVERLYRDVRGLAAQRLNAVSQEAVSVVTDQETEYVDLPHPREVRDRWTADVISAGKLLGKIRRTDWDEAWTTAAQWLGWQHAITLQIRRIWHQDDPENLRRAVRALDLDRQ